MLLQVQYYSPAPNSNRRRGKSWKFSPRASSTPSRTQRIMEKISSGDEVGGAGGAYSYTALKRLDQIWSGLRTAQIDSEKIPQVVTRIPGSFPQPDRASNADSIYDVIVCGGTLGIFVATALASKGLCVGIVERNILKGREQEWNISKKELLELVQVGVLSNDEVEYVIASEFNPIWQEPLDEFHAIGEEANSEIKMDVGFVTFGILSKKKFTTSNLLVNLQNRCGFENKGDIWVQDILNLGVSPAKLLDAVKKRFISLGGALFEAKSLSNISIYDDAAILTMTLSDGEVLPCRLVVDSMGNFSPIVRQVRGGKKPDGMCLVVGTCCHGFDANTTSDVIYSSSSAKNIGNSPVQYFWEAFPAGSGPQDRTTYMFTYVDPQGEGPALEDLLEDYWDLMPAYQGKPLEMLKILRVIFGIFPTYRDSPLPASFDRVLQVGDASGIQSPVSFGGFGSMSRHLGRLSTGIHEAMAGDFLDKDSLSLLNPYMPNLSASWLFQRAMSARPNSGVSSSFINELLFANFQSMQKLGDRVLRPFLQDVIQFEPLVKTLGLVMLSQPQILPSIFKQVGVGVILDWSVHFFMLGYFTFLSSFIDPVMRSWVENLPPRQKYEWRRYLDAWKYGSGLDYHQE